MSATIYLTENIELVNHSKNTYIVHKHILSSLTYSKINQLPESVQQFKLCKISS